MSSHSPKGSQGSPKASSARGGPVVVNFKETISNKSDGPKLVKGKVVPISVGVDPDIIAKNTKLAKLAEHGQTVERNALERENEAKAAAAAAITAQELQLLEDKFKDLDVIFRDDDVIFEGSKQHTEIKPTIRRIKDMIDGLSLLLYNIKLPSIKVFQYDYPDLEEDKTNAIATFENEKKTQAEPDMKPEVDIRERGGTLPNIQQASWSIEKDEPVYKNQPIISNIIDSYIDTKPSICIKCPHGFQSELLRRLCLDPTPQGRYLRLTKDTIKRALDARLKGAEINITLKLKLYSEFDTAIAHYRKIPKNLSRYRLIGLLFVKIQRLIRDFCTITSDWTPGLCPGDFATYMHSHHHYFNLFRMIYDIAKKLKKRQSGLQGLIDNITFFLCKSVFILLTDPEVTRVHEFICKLLEYNDQIDRAAAGEQRNRLITYYVRVVEVLLTRGLLTTRDPDLIQTIFFRKLLSYSPIYVWLQALFVGEVLLPKEQIDQIYAQILATQSSDSSQSSQSSEEFLLNQELSQTCTSSQGQGGGRTKKRGYTNKSKKNIKNKKSGRNKKVRGNNKSRRNQKRS